MRARAAVDGMRGAGWPWEAYVSGSGSPSKDGWIRLARAQGLPCLLPQQALDALPWPAVPLQAATRQRTGACWRATCSRAAAPPCSRRALRASLRRKATGRRRITTGNEVRERVGVSVCLCGVFKSLCEQPPTLASSARPTAVMFDARGKEFDTVRHGRVPACVLRCTGCRGRSSKHRAPSPSLPAPSPPLLASSGHGSPWQQQRAVGHL